MEEARDEQASKELALLEEVSERTNARVNPWWRCKACKVKKWRDRAPRVIFKHTSKCGFSEELKARLVTAHKKVQDTNNVQATERRTSKAAPKSILKQTEDPILLNTEELQEADLEPEDLERLDLGSTSKRPLVQIDPIFHVPGRAGWTVRADTSARRRHVRILSDILYLLIQRRDWSRARRTWALLLRVPEVEWTELWRIGLLLLDKETHIDQQEAVEERIEWLKTTMLRVPYHREQILQELLIELIRAKEFKQVEDQLGMYTEHRYEENATLRGLIGLFHLYKAQLTGDIRGPHSSPESSDDEEKNGTKPDEEPVDNRRGVISASSAPLPVPLHGTEQTARMTEIQEPSYPLPIHLFNPSELQIAKRNFRAALRLDGRNNLAYAFLVLLGDEMVKSQPSKPGASIMSGSDSESESVDDRTILPLSAFVPPSSSSGFDSYDDRLTEDAKLDNRIPEWTETSRTNTSNGMSTSAPTRLPMSGDPRLSDGNFPPALEGLEDCGSSRAVAQRVRDQERKIMDGALPTSPVSLHPSLTPTNELSNQLGVSSDDNSHQSSSPDIPGATQHSNKAVRFAKLLSFDDDEETD